MIESQIVAMRKGELRTINIDVYEIEGRAVLVITGTTQDEIRTEPAIAKAIEAAGQGLLAHMEQLGWAVIPKIRGTSKENYDPGSWHKINDTSYYRYSPNSQKLWWVALQGDILLGEGWYWFVTDARRLESVEYHHSYRFDTWQDATRDCETKGGHR